MEAEVDRDLDQHYDQDRQRDGEAPRHDEGDQNRERRQPVNRLQRVERLDRQHRGAEPAVPPRPHHISVPMLRLQEPTEPAPPLPQERHRAGRRIGPRERAADDANGPVTLMVDRMAVQPVDQLIILDHAIGIEPADLDHRRAPERRERARNQQQAVEPLPRMARQEIADIFVGLKPFEEAPLQIRPADRREHTGCRDQRRLGRERRAHRRDRAGFEQRVGIDRQHHFGIDQHHRRIERARLATVTQPQPAQRRQRGRGIADRAIRRRLQPVAPRHHLGRRIARSVIGDQDQIGRRVLSAQPFDRGGDHARLVMRRDDHAEAGRDAWGWLRCQAQIADVPRGEQQQRGVVQDIGDPDRPHRQPLPLERLDDQRDKQDRREGTDESAGDRHTPRGKPRRFRDKRVGERCHNAGGTDPG